MRFSYGIERDRCCLSRKTARRSLCRLSRKLRETVFYYGLSPWELQLQNMHKMVTICLLSPDRERPTAMPWASRSSTSVLVLLRPAAGAAHIAGGGGIHEDQPRHVDIVLFRRLLGRMIAPDAALIGGGRSVLFGTFLPVYPKIQFAGSAMALRTKAVISSPSRSTLRSMSASIRFHRNCRKKPT